MIKRICKTKQSKHGAILVVVVLILALAMIFIASAMMLTQSTRTRLYERTMQSQARLTVTAASEVFLEALQTQEITDDQIDALLAASHEKHDDNKDKIKMVVDGVPGMSTAEDNCTYLDLYYKEDATDTVCADFTTVIGDEIENVQVVLVIQEPDGEAFEIFNNQIDIGGSVSNNNLRFTQGVGMYNKDVTPANNNIVIRGSSANQTNDSIFYSNVIYTGEVYSFWGGKGYFMGDVIFKQKSYLTTKDSGPVIKGDLFFFDKSDNGCFRFHQEGGWDSIMNSSSTRIVINDDLAPQGPDCTQSVAVDQYSSYNPGKDNNQKIKEVLEKRPVYFVDNKNKTVSAKNVKGTYQVKNAAVDQANGTYKGLPDDLASKNTKYKNSKISSFPQSCSEVFATINPVTNTASKGIKTVSKDLPKFTRTEYEAVTDSSGNVTYIVHPKGSDVGGKDVKVYEYPLTTTFPDKNYFIDGNGKSPDAAGGAAYTAKYYELYDKNGNIRADHKIALTKSGFDAIDGKTITVNNTNAGTVKTKVDKDGSANGVIDLKPGWYQFTPGTLDNGTTPYIIAIDGSRADEYRLYFSKGTNGEYWFKSLIIAVYNVQESKSVFTLLEPGVKLSLSCCNNRDCGKALCIAGFLSVQRDECGSASALAQYVKGGCNGRMGGHLKGGADGECQSWQRPDGTNYKYFKDGAEKGDIKYSKYYDSIRKPSMFIFGQGVELRANSGSVLEAYCGFYKNGNTKSVFGGTEGHLDGSFPCYIYGRVECDTFDCGNSQECYCMPYCPQPGGSTTQDPQRRAVTKYKVSNIIYYYKKDKAGS